MVNPPSGDQYFLLNFITSTFLGPDVYSDNPRCSAAHRLAKGLPPYTSNNLGDSFLRVSQFECLYYYVLRNAHPSLVLNPKMLYSYLEGKFHLSSSGVQEDCRQFTSSFPLNIHRHKRYSASHEIVKGIVFIGNPDTSYLKKEDLERFRFLSGMDSLSIDIKKCLSYKHGSQEGGEKTEQTLMPRSDAEKTAATNISSRNERPPSMFQHTYKRRKPPSMFQHTYRRRRRGVCDLPKPDRGYDTIGESIILTGTATRGISEPTIGVVDIGVCETAYLFQVAVPGVRTDFCEFSCEIESDGKVHIRGTTSGGKIIRKRSSVFHKKFQQIPTGPFTISFNLPGPVDPRLFSPDLRTDGIFEGVIIKKKK